MSPTTPAAVFLRLPEVKRMTCLSRATIYRMMANNTFPKNFRIGANSRTGAVGWYAHEIEAWINSRARIGGEVL